MEVELRSALEERNRAQADASEGSLGQDDVVAQARSDRDDAVQRRTKAEIELAKVRVELMRTSSELYEAINQKVELSQQLEQWQVSLEINQLPNQQFFFNYVFKHFCLYEQVDMHELLEEQMKRQLEESQRKNKTALPASTPQKPTYSHMLMRLFQR